MPRQRDHRRMDALVALVDQLEGFAQKHELVAHGATDRMLTAAVRSGRLRRPRRGWYSTLHERDPRFRAVRVGGRLTGMSALTELGAWTWDPGPLHVAVRGNASRQRDQFRREIRRDPSRHHDVVVHWRTDRDRWPPSRATVHPMEALRRVVLDEPFEIAVAALDWSMRFGVIDTIGLHQIGRALPEERRRIVNWVDPACDSIPESICRTRFALRGFRVASQVPVGDFERIDLVVEHVVALEIDGRQHAGSFERDRRKDLRITAKGLHAIRPTYWIVRSEFQALLSAVVVAIRARDGTWRPPVARRRPHPRLRRSRCWVSLDAPAITVPARPPEIAATLVT